MPENRNYPVGRADRILDAAGALLVRLGYRKVTIEDIARQADIGKGTIYLHWRTKEQLFEALMLREFSTLLAELVDRVRADPAEIVPHRFFRASFLAAHRRPLVTALIAGDRELLGRLLDHPLHGHDLVAKEQFYELMTRNGLVRDDIPNLAYAMEATEVGFHLAGGLHVGEGGLEPEAEADALAHTIRHAFEPATEPPAEAVAATAAELIAIFEETAAGYQKWIYPHDPAPGPA
ncbi:TetR/AcrR family transcriptional regulator [Amycolatopsis anabasis]|uniref:TetR/AcrR family transcriptional regulator n=1 Tax=Amycolatopsis anabasis TaxID=1840409 RepID=UPI001FE731D4|nr:TetR/AcrR family transcriptional regulator [Amycolatopsis anabasis]